MEQAGVEPSNNPQSAKAEPLPLIAKTPPPWRQTTWWPESDTPTHPQWTQTTEWPPSAMAAPPGVAWPVTATSVPSTETPREMLSFFSQAAPSSAPHSEWQVSAMPDSAAPPQSQHYAGPNPGLVDTNSLGDHVAPALSEDDTASWRETTNPELADILWDEQGDTIVAWVGKAGWALTGDQAALVVGTMPIDCRDAVMKRCTEKGTVRGSMVDDGGWLWARMNSPQAANRVVSRLNDQTICEGRYIIFARLTKETSWPSGGSAWSQMVSQPRNDTWHNPNSWTVGKDGKRMKGGKRHKQAWKKGGGEKGADGETGGWPAPY